MTQFASDTFTATAGTTLQTLTGWNKHSATAFGNAIISGANRVRSDSGGTSMVYYHSTGPNSADYSVSVDVVILSNDGSLQAGTALARVNTAASTWYQADLITTGNANEAKVRLYKIVAGTPTALVADSAVFAANVSDVFTIKVECIGTTISAYKNGSLMLTATDSDISAAGKAGIAIFNISASDVSSWHLDNFSGDDTSSVPADVEILMGQAVF